MEEQLSALMDKLAGQKRRSAKKAKLKKRDSVIFAAIFLDRVGTGYRAFLHEYGIKPKWADGDPSTATYPMSYKTGDPWRKKVQDEKSRAKIRLDRYNETELADAFHTFLPGRLDELREKLAIMPR